MAIKLIYWKDADFTALCESFENDDKHKFKYSNLAAAFDIETSTAVIEDNKKIAFMYIWQLAVEKIVVYGRTWEEFRNCIKKLRKELKLSSKYKLITYVHNLKYEFSFFKNEVEIQPYDFLARDKNNVIKCSVENVIVFKDNYSYSEKSLKEIGKEVGISKLELDYSPVRTHITPLNKEELEYCAIDVIILVEYIKKLRDIYKRIDNIPLTLTQAIKKIINANCKDEKNYKQIISTKLNNSEKDRLILEKLQKAFIGGVNYYNPDCRDLELNNISSVDIVSSYPAQILLHKFPITKFTPIEVPKDYNDIINKSYYNTKPLLITFEVSKLESKYPYLSFLSDDLKKYYKIDKHNTKFLHGKILSSNGSIKLCLTDIDYSLFLQFYKTEDIKIISVYASHYGYLPKYILQTVIELYQKKNHLKKQLKKIKKFRALTPKELAEYDFVKSLLNRIYGVFVQDPKATNYEFDKLKGVVEDRGEKRINRRCPVLYQWGVWVTSWGRYELLNLFKKITVREQPNGKENYIDDIINMDTDSIKYKNKITNNIISQYNEKVNTEVKKFCNRNEIEYSILKGIGTFESEKYKVFKIIGLKRYCYIDEKDNFVFHISGLPRENKYFDSFKTNSEKMEAFNVNLELDEDTACKHQTRYYTKDIETTVTDYLGTSTKIFVKSFCLITDIGFKNDPTHHYIDLLNSTSHSEAKELFK